MFERCAVSESTRANHKNKLVTYFSVVRGGEEKKKRTTVFVPEFTRNARDDGETISPLPVQLNSFPNAASEQKKKKTKMNDNFANSCVFTSTRFRETEPDPRRTEKNREFSRGEGFQGAIVRETKGVS